MAENTQKKAAFTGKASLLAILFLLPVAAHAQFQDPARYFSYQTQTTEDTAWAPIHQHHACSSTSAGGTPVTPTAVRIVAMSDADNIIQCDLADMAGTKARINKGIEDLRAAEISASETARASLDQGIPNFSADAMLMNLIKYASEPLKEQVWLSAAEQEIKLAQSADRYGASPGQQTGNWVFPPESLRDRNPTVAAQELLAQFKAEVLKRAKRVQTTFVLRTKVGNLRYDHAAGAILFGNGKVSDSPIAIKSPINAKFNGVPLYSLNSANDGLMKYADGKQHTVVGLRNATAMGPPVLATDRQLSVYPIKIPQDQAERLLNGTQQLNVNVVMTITGADRQLSQGNYASVSTHGVLFAQVDKVFLTDPTGQVLAIYDAETLPRWPSAQAARAQ